MARIRSIKPEMRRSRTVAAWPREVRYAFVLLFGYLDDEGRGEDELDLLKADLFPRDRDVTERKLDGWLWTMVETDPTDPTLCRYEVDGRQYLHAPKWKSHQKINRPQPSRIPPCPVHDGGRVGSLRHRGGFTERSVNPHGTVTAPAVSVQGSITDESLRARKDQGSGIRGAEEQGSEDSATPAAERGAEVIPIGVVTAQTLVAEWIEHCQPHRPPKQIIGQIAKLLGDMLGDDIPPPIVRAGLAEWHRACATNTRGQHPASLPSFVHAAQVAGSAPAPTRRSTTDDRVAVGLELAAKYAAMDAESGSM